MHKHAILVPLGKGILERVSNIQRVQGLIKDFLYVACQMKPRYNATLRREKRGKRIIWGYH